MAGLTKKRRLTKQRRTDLIFYCCMIAFPVIQFLIFYIGVNLNSMLLSFKDIDIVAGTETWTFAHIREAFTLMTTSPMHISAFKMSLLCYVIGLVVGVPLGLLFSYYIYKKFPMGNTLRVILFLPSIISAIVMVTIFQFFVERAIPAAASQWFGIEMQGLIENTDTRFATIMFYNILVSFGMTALIYSNGMAGISPEIVEAAQLDGCTGLREFWHITLPLIYPTITTFLITGVAGIFTNQMNLYSFFGTSAPESLFTWGYYLYVQTQVAASEAEYPLLAAMGLLLTVVIVPVTLLVKWLLEKYGPKTE